MEGARNKRRREKNGNKENREKMEITPCEHRESDVCGDERGKRGKEEKRDNSDERHGFVMKDRQSSE